jgi:hypothetical protein
MVRNIPLGWLLLATAGCSNLQDKSFTGVGSGDGGGETDADTDTDSDTDSDTDADTDTGTTGGSDGFDDPGDVVTYETDENGIATVDLADGSGDSNEFQEFYMVVMNTSADALGFQLRYFPSDGGGNMARPMPVAKKITPARPPMEKPEPFPPPANELSESDVGFRRTEFLVRSDVEDTSEYAVVNATLWALGDNVAIWVDDDVPIDWDVDCDGDIDAPDTFEAYGFDNCDLSSVAEIIDGNIIPNVTELYGEASDLNGDQKISIVVTPVLNAITLTSEDDADWSTVLPSYAEPTVDLYPYDLRTNPGSDEQEVVYVYAPDPYGFFNPYTAPTVEEYTSFQLAAQFAKSFTTLVTFNQKVEVYDGTVEEDWLNDALGAFAADYCGFGAAYHADAWLYLDAPHLQPLVTEASNGNLDVVNYGAQYLFARFLYDYAEQSDVTTGRDFLGSIVQRADVGTVAVEGAASSLGDDFGSLVLKWQVALLTSGMLADDGSELVDSSVWPAFVSPSNLSAPPDSPGAYYGANGYQMGLDLRGTNSAWTGGTTDSPLELQQNRVLLEGPDAYLHTPGFEFNGYVQPQYATTVIRLAGIPYEAAMAELQATGAGLVGTVVRWNDPASFDYTIEDIYSATDANAVELPTLPADGTPIYGAGAISAPGRTYMVDSAGDLEEADVVDTDRWLLDLSAEPWGEPVEVAVWLDRHFADTSGAAGPDDPWLAIVPEEWVPVPTVEGTATAENCGGAVDFAYPASVLEYLYYQVFLADTMLGEPDADFDSCGEVSETATCDVDWDGDGVSDDDEPQPATLYEQIEVMRCTTGASNAYDTDWMDTDEQDEDDLPTSSRAYNTGGASGVEGEEAYVRTSLVGGQRYLVIVGAGSGTGAYEISARRTN